MAEVLKHHKARKRFGQNFLNDDFWINKIAEAVDPIEFSKKEVINVSDCKLCYWSHSWTWQW